MATRFGRWTLQFAPPSLERGARAFRLMAREKHVLVPSRTAFEPPADLYETRDEFVVRVEIAGLRSSHRQTTVEIDGDVLRVAGERTDPAAGERRHYDQMEVETGRFERVLRLPMVVDPSGASASYDDGFLVIRLPKREPVKAAPQCVRVE